MNTQEFNFEEIYKNFAIDGTYVGCKRYGEGHINDTFKLTVDCNGVKVNYISQRVNNRLFKDVGKLMRNIELVTSFCRQSVIKRGGDPERECLNVVSAKDRKSYYYDGENYFRVYVFIENATTYQIVRNPKDFYESAVAFGSFADFIRL